VKELFDRFIECLNCPIDCLCDIINNASKGDGKENNMFHKRKKHNKGAKNMDGKNANESNHGLTEESSIKSVSQDASNIRNEPAVQQVLGDDGLSKVLKKIGSLETEIGVLKNALGSSKDGDPRMGSLFDALRTLREDVRNLQKGLGSNLLGGSSSRLSDLVRELKNEVSHTAKESSLSSVVKTISDTLTGPLTSQVAYIESVRQRLTGLHNAVIGIPAKIEDIKGSVSKLQQVQGGFSEFAESGFQSVLKSELKPLQELETVSGKVANLASDIEEIRRVLTDKGLEVRQKFPAASADEEVICQMADYGRTILDQLSVAARWYARSKTDIDQASDLRAQAEKEHQKGYDEGKEAGKAEGKASFIEELVKRCGDCSSLFIDGTDQQNADGRLKILSDLLQGEGLHRGHHKDEIIEVHDEKEAAVLENPPHEFPKKVRITNSDFYLGDKLLQKAVWEPADENAPEGAPAGESVPEGSPAGGNAPEGAAADVGASQNSAEQNAAGSEGSAPVNG